MYACSNLTFCIIYLSFRLVRTRLLLGTTTRQIHRHGRSTFFHFKYIMSGQSNLPSLFLRKKLVLTNRMTLVGYIVRTTTKDARRCRSSLVGGLFKDESWLAVATRLLTSLSFPSFALLGMPLHIGHPHLNVTIFNLFKSNINLTLTLTMYQSSI